MVPFGSSGTRYFVQLACLDEVHQPAGAKRHRQKIIVLGRRIISCVVELNYMDEPRENVVTITGAVAVKIPRKANRPKAFVIRCLIGQSRTTIANVYGLPDWIAMELIIIGSLADMAPAQVHHPTRRNRQWIQQHDRIAIN